MKENPDRNNNLSKAQLENEKEIDSQLRPSNFDDFTGQKKLVDNLKVFISAALKKGDVWTIHFLQVSRSWKNNVEFDNFERDGIEY